MKKPFLKSAIAFINTTKNTGLTICKKHLLNTNKQITSNRFSLKQHFGEK